MRKIWRRWNGWAGAARPRFASIGAVDDISARMAYHYDDKKRIASGGGAGLPERRDDRIRLLCVLLRASSRGEVRM
jgi:hypothetical protein